MSSRSTYMSSATANLLPTGCGRCLTLFVTVEIALAMPDRVSASFAHAGTHVASCLGNPRTGRRMRLASFNTSTVTDGRLREHRGTDDITSVMARLKG